MSILVPANCRYRHVHARREAGLQDLSGCSLMKKHLPEARLLVVIPFCVTVKQHELTALDQSMSSVWPSPQARLTRS